ncbi:hypothetical protein Y1Q_0009132 [Alligator mississippiensis]|uniref:Uncharacterized protein n=1 Tax=Alligator mississippiensis TaxID=8496 RepID=A0A151M2J7_ALLMI|nr:hypothetical protein Y1Q_0009132 [Alligator mississippiensis]
MVSLKELQKRGNKLTLSKDDIYIVQMYTVAAKGWCFFSLCGIPPYHQVQNPFSKALQVEFLELHCAETPHTSLESVCSR